MGPLGAATNRSSDARQRRLAHERRASNFEFGSIVFPVPSERPRGLVHCRGARENRPSGATAAGPDQDFASLCACRRRLGHAFAMPLKSTTARADGGKCTAFGGTPLPGRNATDMDRLDD
jgi:hypothetical protein